MNTKDIVIIVLIFAVVLIVIGFCFGLFHTNNNSTNLTDNNTTSYDIAYLVKEGKQIKKDQTKNNNDTSSSKNIKSSGTNYSNVKYYDSNDPYVDKEWDEQNERYVYLTKSGKYIDPTTGKEPYSSI